GGDEGPVARSTAAAATVLSAMSPGRDVSDCRRCKYCSALVPAWENEADSAAWPPGGERASRVCTGLSAARRIASTSLGCGSPSSSSRTLLGAYTASCLIRRCCATRSLSRLATVDTACCSNWPCGRTVGAPECSVACCGPTVARRTSVPRGGCGATAERT